MKRAAWTMAILGLLLLAGAGCGGCVDWVLANDRGLPEAVLPAAAGLKFRVAVLGDSQKGLLNLSNIVSAVLKEDPQLLLHTGDLVSKNDEGHYRLALSYLRRGGAGHRPVTVPGNHDIKGGPDRFVRRIGPLEQAFRVGEVGFVILNDAFGDPPDPRHVESLIASLGSHRAVVAAMHVPPFDLQGRVQPGFEPFLAWLEKSGINYLLCGHVHGYFKKQVGRTTVIVNGVGGDYDQWQLGQPVHATILEVDGGTITDRAIAIPSGHGVWENIHHFAAGHLGEAYRQHPVWAWGGTLALAALTGFAIGVIRLRRPGLPDARV